MNIFAVIFMNFWGFDLLIFIAAVFNGIVFYIVKHTADELRRKMNHNVFVPHYGVSSRQMQEAVSTLSEEEILSLNGATGRLYSLFVNITGIFPLLGILGTVVSLLGLVSDMENVTGNFYGALTSTFWGLIFAIIFKFLDGIISPEIESNEKSVHIYLESVGRTENGMQPGTGEMQTAVGAAPAEAANMQSEAAGAEIHDEENG